MYLNKAAKLDYLSEINILFLSEINQILGISTILRKSGDFILKGDKSERLLHICKETNASPDGRNDLSLLMLVDNFRLKGLKVRWVLFFSKYTPGLRII